VGGSVAVTGTFWQTTQPVYVTNPTTATVSGTVAATQSGTWSVSPGTGTYPVAGTVAATQSGGWTSTVTQGTNSNLRGSVMIDGSSNTVTATQSGAWSVSPGTGTYPIAGTVTATQGTNANLRASVDIDGSSNTVVLGAGTANVGKIVYQTPTVGALTTIAISSSTTGDNVIVSTQSAQTVRVFRMFIVVSAATNITLKSGGSTNLTGAMTFNAGGAFILDFSGEPWFVTSASNAFIINQSGTAQISGSISYTQS